MTDPDRKGILAGGNFVVDHVKQIDHYPAQDHLAQVRSESLGTGGGPYNLLRDLAIMNVAFPLQAVGLIGDDANGQWIIDDCRQQGIDIQRLQRTSEAGTSWTDVMSVQSTARRTFFHYTGTNALLADHHFCFDESEALIFYLGYLTLLEQLDEDDGNGRTGASRVLERARSAGLITAADLVSGNNPRFREIVTAAAPQLDYLLLNELEAGWIVNRDLSGNSLSVEALKEAAQEILELGVSTAVVLHFERGAVSADRNGALYQQGAVRLPAGLIQATVGAGDAFAAGFLYGVHQSFIVPECLHYAVCAAAACLTGPTCSDGMRPLKECLALGEEYGFVSP